PAEDPSDPAPNLPPPLPEELAEFVDSEASPPEAIVPAEEPTDPAPNLPPPLPEELSSLELASDPSNENLETEASEQKIPSTKSVLPPPVPSLPPPEEAPPAPTAESIAESYEFPSKKEESPDDQPEDSSLETDAKNTEELKPPPF
ncbi:MAG: hypothetical protein HN531_09685, partial [Opitutae bacterium]|nr:hypothetical protein [Opitutae bacterium]